MAVKENKEVKIKMKSSFVKMTCYHYRLHRLIIVFKNSTYRFYGVPVEVYHGLLASDSTGRYFREYIREKYNYEKEA